MKTIVLMRHAEKPTDESHDVNLSPEGLKRARCIGGLVHTVYGKPNYIFAAADSKESHRPTQTATPLASMYDMPINVSFIDAQPKKLAKELNRKKYDGKII